MLYNMQKSSASNMQLLAEKLLVGSFYTTIVWLCCSKNNEVVIH